MMWTDDPVLDEMNYTLAKEEAEERWLADRPTCPFCHEKVGREEWVDLSRGDFEDGYVWHADCLQYALKFNKLNMTLGEQIYFAMEAEWGGNDT